MKYVRWISLFFVYPAICFVLGVILGYAMPEYGYSGSEELKLQINRVSAQGSPIINDEQDKVDVIEQQSQKEPFPHQQVINPSAIQQTEGEGNQGEGYFVTLLNNYVVVYHGDRATIFLFTDIKAEELPREIQINLENGISMENEGALYDFLENYTS